MPHNRFFTPDELTLQTMITLEEEEFHHIAVMRLSENEEVELVNGKGLLAKARIQKMHKKKVDLLITHIHKENPPSIHAHLALSLIKPSLLEFAIEKVTELGITEISLFPALYSEKRELSENAKARLEKITISALKQCGRLYLPKISYFSSLKEVLSSKNPSFYCDLVGNAPKLFSQIQNQKNFTVFIGPEKGFSKEEKRLLSENATVCLLAPNILRAETAAITAASLIAQII